MATNKNVYGLCDTCGFRYKLRQLKKLVMEQWYVLKIMMEHMI